MRKGVLRTYDLYPDGVRVVVKWDELQVGMSIFIPCINTQQGGKSGKTYNAKTGLGYRDTGRGS